MTWTFDPTLATPRDQVRWLVADTEETDPLQQDETIETVLTWQPNPYRAAVVVAKQIARQFARQCDLDIAKEVRINLSDRSRNYARLAQDLEEEANKGAGMAGVGVFAGGLETTITHPAFCRGLFGTQASPSCRRCGQGLCTCDTEAV